MKLLQVPVSAAAVIEREKNDLCILFSCFSHIFIILLDYSDVFRTSLTAGRSQESRKSLKWESFRFWLYWSLISADVNVSCHLWLLPSSGDQASQSRKSLITGPKSSQWCTFASTFRTSKSILLSLLMWEMSADIKELLMFPDLLEFPGEIQREETCFIKAGWQ